MSEVFVEVVNPRGMQLKLDFLVELEDFNFDASLAANSTPSVEIQETQYEAIDGQFEFHFGPDDFALDEKATEQRLLNRYSPRKVSRTSNRSRSHVPVVKPVEQYFGSDWGSKSACKDVDPDLFHFKKTARLAKQVCEMCTVRVACLEDALDKGETLGVRGGLDESERRSLHSRRRKLNLPV